LNNLFQTAKENWDTEELSDRIDDIMEVKNMFETALKERDKKMIEQGIEQEKYELAAKMKKCGYSIEEISKITELSAEEISEL
jgi:predicted transposase/invertase (TIGR01784 family)